MAKYWAGESWITSNSVYKDGKLFCRATLNSFAPQIVAAMNAQEATSGVNSLIKSMDALQTEIRGLREARAEVIERCAAIVESVIRSECGTATKPSDGCLFFCEEYGCKTLRGLAAEIRALKAGDATSGKPEKSTQAEGLGAAPSRTPDGAESPTLDPTK